MADEQVTLSKDELASMMETAAETGARRALRLVGLHDESAPKDLMELRGLLESWRSVRKSALETIGRMITTGILLMLVGAAATYFLSNRPH